jgi:protein involved in polysaccharide export with SLBB domain
LRVDGYTAPEIAELAAQAVGVNPEQVEVRVVQFNSQQIYLFGQVNGAQRAVAYQGGEPVLHLLQRVGGITRGAEPNDIYVVRPRLSAGRPPEVFHIQLRDIVSGDDPRTNLVLQPFDEIYVGETRKSGFFKCLPPCLRPFFKSVCGMRRPCALGPAQ